MDRTAYWGDEISLRVFADAFKVRALGFRGRSPSFKVRFTATGSLEGGRRRYGKVAVAPLQGGRRCLCAVGGGAYMVCSTMVFQVGPPGRASSFGVCVPIGPSRLGRPGAARPGQSGASGWAMSKGWRFLAEPLLEPSRTFDIPMQEDGLPPCGRAAAVGQ